MLSFQSYAITFTGAVYMDLMNWGQLLSPRELPLVFLLCFDLIFLKFKFNAYVVNSQLQRWK